MIPKVKCRLQKKQSEIIVGRPQGSCSPFKRPNGASPFNRTPTKKNVSPLRSKHPIFYDPPKSPRKVLTDDNSYNQRSPRPTENSFDQQISYMMNTYQTTPHGCNSSKFGLKGAFTPQSSAFMNISNRREQPSQRQMLTSKKVFARAVAQMGSQRKNIDISKQTSNFDSSKRNISQDETQPITFKALKQIKFIQSFQCPEDNAPVIVMSKKPSQIQQAQTTTVTAFDQDEKQPQMKAPFALIQQQMNIASKQAIFEKIQLDTKQKKSITQKKNLQAYEQVDQSSDFSGFNFLISKIQKNSQKNHYHQDILHSVRISTESIKGGLTMDPYF